jgi:hypothetical protein
MSEHGDAVWQYLKDVYGDGMHPLGSRPGDPAIASWAGLACWYVSAAVKSWAQCAEDEILAAIHEGGQS